MRRLRTSFKKMVFHTVLRVVLGGAVVALGAAAWRGADTALATNLATLAAALVVALAGACGRAARAEPEAPSGAPPVGRSRPRLFVRAELLPPLLAIAVAWPTLALPWLADDWYFLEVRGNTGSLWRTLAARPDGEIWFRPVAWLPWRAYHESFSGAPWVAHAISIALFAGTVALVVPLARRCGLVRSTAVAASALFAVAPAALETVAWVTNQCTLLATFFSLAALALLPEAGSLGSRRERAARHAMAAVAALLACLSKEEAFVLPAAGALLLARFELRALPRALLHAWPLWLALAVALALRAAYLGGLGGYRDPATGASTLARNPWPALRSAFATELPARYLLPMRASLAPALAWLVAPLVPLAILALGAGAKGAGRGVARGGLFFLVFLAPLAPVLPIGDQIDEARWLYAPAIGLAIAAGACLAPAPAAPAGVYRWGWVVAFAAASVLAGRMNFVAWRRAAEAAGRSIAALQAPLAQAPEGSAVVVHGLPNQVDGAFCFLTGRRALLARLGRARSLRFPDEAGSLGTVGAALAIDPALGTSAPLLDGPPLLRLRAGEIVGIDPAHRPGDLQLLRPVNVSERAGDLGGHTFWSHYADGVLLLPAVSLPLGARLRWTLDGGYLAPGGRLEPPAVIATTAAEPEEAASRPAAAARRVKLAEGEWLSLPAGSDRARLEIPIAAGRTLEIRVLTLEVEAAR